MNKIIKNDLEYDCIMKAIELLRDEVLENGIPPYDNEHGYTDDDVLGALDDVEKRIQAFYL